MIPFDIFESGVFFPFYICYNSFDILPFIIYYSFDDIV